MKHAFYPLVVACLLLGMYLPQAEFAMSKQAMEQTKTMVKNMCKKKSGVKQSLLSGMKNGEFPEERTLMCYLGCCASTMQIIVKGNQLNEKFIMKQINTMLPEEMRAGVLRQVEGCRHIKGKDACELGWEMAKCAYSVDPEVFLIPI